MWIVMIDLFLFPANAPTLNIDRILVAYDASLIKLFDSFREVKVRQEKGYANSTEVYTTTVQYTLIISITFIKP